MINRFMIRQTKTHHYKFLVVILFNLLLCNLTSCDNIDVDDNDEVPFAITSFVDQYFPGQAIGRCKLISDEIYDITVHDGPSMTLKIVRDSNINPYCSLLSYDGNGQPMPRNMAFNYFDETLYDYIDGLGMLNLIYEMNVAGDIIYVELQDTEVIYNTKTGVITQK